MTDQQPPEQTAAPPPPPGRVGEDSPTAPPPVGSAPTESRASRSGAEARPGTGGGEPSVETEPTEEATGAGGEEAEEADQFDPLVIALKEKADYLDTVRRLQAEFENYRKRSQREASEASTRALGAFVEQLLPVLDAVDLARAHGSEEVDQVGSLLIDLLAKQGLERIDPKGSVFDPTAHEAVVHEEGDDPLGVQTVAEVFRSGWRWRGKVLRPAMVKVVG